MKYRKHFWLVKWLWFPATLILKYFIKILSYTNKHLVQLNKLITLEGISKNPILAAVHIFKQKSGKCKTGGVYKIFLSLDVHLSSFYCILIKCDLHLKTVGVSFPLFRVWTGGLIVQAYLKPPLQGTCPHYLGWWCYSFAPKVKTPPTPRRTQTNSRLHSIFQKARGKPAWSSEPLTS